MPDYTVRLTRQQAAVLIPVINGEIERTKAWINAQDCTVDDRTHRAKISEAFLELLSETVAACKRGMG